MNYMMDKNYKLLDTQRIADYISSFADKVRVEDILRKHPIAY